MWNYEMIKLILKRRNHYRRWNVSVSKANLEQKSLEIENKLYLEELEQRVKDLEKENQKLRLTIDNYKIEKFKDMGKDQEEGVIQTQKFYQFIKDSLLDEENSSVKSDKTLSWNKFIEFFNRVAKKNILKKFNIIDNAFSYILDHVIPPHFCRHFSEIDQPIKMSLEELKNFK